MKKITMCFSAVLLITGCAGDKKNVKKDAPSPAMLAVEVKEDAETEKYDLNGDKKPDVWKDYNLSGTKETPNAQRKRIIAQKRMDVNFDGDVDMVVSYNVFGAVVSEKMDLDFDKTWDAIDYYADGVLIRKELSTKFKKKGNENWVADIWKYYSKGKLTRKERDTNQNGKPDVFEYYEKGKLTRLGYDRDGDGKPDDFDQVSNAAQ